MDRAARLQSLCGGDEALLREVRSLLDAWDAQQRLTVSEPTRSEVGPVESGHIDATAGQRIGPYRLDRLSGRGGMGAVYLASRVDGQFDQQVAIKLIDLPWPRNCFAKDSDRNVRFWRGSTTRIIAKILDGGVTEGGELYLAMEFADGLPIGQHCSQRSLPLRERIGLFLSVCSAVRFAHQNLVVHRDLKPDNIIVLKDGTPKTSRLRHRQTAGAQ